jgi:enoyl-CoA hydratase/carnithine racemase
MPLDPADLERAGLRLDIDTREHAEGAGAAAAVATVTLDRPRRRNAMTPGMWRGLAGVGRALPPEVRVVVIRGEGETFSAGLDLRLLSAEGVPGEEPPPDPRGEGFEAWIADCQAGFSWLRGPGIVSIAAVRGHAIGAGFQLALSCDLRVFADDARVCMKEPALGLVPDLTGTKPLVDLVGPARALEICATGRWVHAEEAERVGLANLVVPASELHAAAADLAAALLASPRDAVIETKALLAGAGSRTFEEQRAAERAAQLRRLRDLAGLAE